MSESLSSILMPSSMPSVNPPSAIFAADDRNFRSEQTADSDVDDVRFNDVFSEELKLNNASTDVVESVSDASTEEAISSVATSILSELKQQAALKLQGDKVRPLFDDPTQQRAGRGVTLEQLQLNPIKNEVLIDSQRLTLVEQTIEPSPATTVATLEEMIKPLSNSEQLLQQLQDLKNSIDQVTPVIAEEAIVDKDVELEVAQRLLQPIEQLISLPDKFNTAENTKEVDSEQLTTIKDIIKQLPEKDQQQLVTTVPVSVASAANVMTQFEKERQLAVELAQRSTTLAGMADNQMEGDKVVESIPLPAKDLTLVPQAVTSSSQSLISQTKILGDDLTQPMTQIQTLVGLKTEPLTQVTTSEPANTAVIANFNALDRKDKAADTDKDTDVTEISDDEVNQDNKPVKATDNFDLLFKKMMQTEAQQSVKPSERISMAPVSSELLDSIELSQINQDKKEISGMITKEQMAATKAVELTTKLPLHHETSAAKALKERVSLMVNGGIQHAIIQLDPEELGGMSIRLQLQNDQMNVQFQVQNSQAKEMLENAMSKLKEMLEQQGIVLQDSDVSQQNKGSEQQLTEQQQGERLNGSDDEFESDQSVVTLNLNKHSTDGIDYYA
ncbi:MAG: flagellar hook-length control protein FliK [Gammaproteobacteria bacterium]|nr:flagellar hook-length control protein FliK [Gammaproteobacteria bacterium]